ncbi:ATP-binding protein [Anaerosalibacter massiliensis]|uniref:ATP-binding protein n=1 Tax=Anaerosalibacter massiliensis TaxID=1347392 RepID=A0A9X2MGJ8_9FIRM|nr:ATP-binding protein [Anaerosalibacter massiliensis]MCR2043269.1 ATP-binding protein [Anaerosalibacter massiliensis]
MSFKFDGSVCSDLHVIKDFVEDVLEKLNRIIDDESTMFEVKLILNELVANGAIHGNAYDREKSVNLCIEVIEDSIRIEVTDEGEGFEYDLRNYDPLDLKCSGRGLVIVDGLSDELYVRENKIVSVKYI